MFFLPYRLDADLPTIPWLTLFICVACIGVHFAQQSGDERFWRETRSYCEAEHRPMQRIMLRKATGHAGAGACGQLLIDLSRSEDPVAEIAALARDGERFGGMTRADSERYLGSLIGEYYYGWRSTVAPSVTDMLVYEPEKWNVGRMFSASVAHGDWSHLIGNLVFMFVFGAAVELIIGTLGFSVAVALVAVASHVGYSVYVRALGLDPVPSLGLSGVVMGMIAMLAVFYPFSRVRCFYWVLIKVGVLRVPTWLLALLYIGFDAWALTTDGMNGGTNLVAHVAGAAAGIVVAWTAFYRHRATHQPHPA